MEIGTGVKLPSSMTTLPGAVGGGRWYGNGPEAMTGDSTSLGARRSSKTCRPLVAPNSVLKRVEEHRALRLGAAVGAEARGEQCADGHDVARPCTG